MVAMGWRWRSPRGAPLHLPRLSLTAYSQTVRHIDRVLLAAERSLLRRVAVGIGGDDDAEALEAVTAFRASLPSRSRVLRTSVLVIFVLGVARGLASLVPKTGISLPIYTGHKIAGPSIDHLFDGTLGVLNPDSSSIGSAVDSLFNASLGTLAVSAMLLIVAAYLVLRPVMSAFRLKRLMFNLYPHAEGVLHEVPASWSVSRATGVYALEREAFAAFGARMPGEVPLDLIVPLPVVLAYIALIVAALVSASHEPGSSGLGGLLFAALLYCAPALLRIAWLAAVWRARRGGPRSLLATDVAVPWSSRPVRCRSPALILYTALMASATFPVLVWAWYWATCATWAAPTRSSAWKGSIPSASRCSSAWARFPGARCRARRAACARRNRPLGSSARSLATSFCCCPRRHCCALCCSASSTACGKPRAHRSTPATRSSRTRGL
jgi:hypothetical protein